MVSLRSLGICVCLLLVSTAPCSTRAQDAAPESADAEARSLFQRGDRAYSEGRYEAALALFEEAYALSARPALLYNLANALERLGRTEEAITRLRAFAEHATDEQQEVVARRIEALEARLARQEVEENERERAERERIEAEIEQEREREPAPVMTTPTPWGGIALIGAGVLVAGAGIAMGVVSSSTGNDALTRCVPGSMGALCPASTAADFELARNLALGADISFGVAGVLAVAGTVWMAVDLSSSTPSEASAHLSFGPSGASVFGHF